MKDHCQEDIQDGIQEDMFYSSLSNNIRALKRKSADAIKSKIDGYKTEIGIIGLAVGWIYQHLSGQPVPQVYYDIFATLGIVGVAHSREKFTASADKANLQIQELISTVEDLKKQLGEK